MRLLPEMLTDEYRYKILKLIEANPSMSQRELARQLDISLGKTNFCLKALIEKGLLKASNFKNSKKKSAYLYFLTPKGFEEKASVSVRFLKHKMREYEKLEAEIAQIRNDLKLHNESNID